MNLLKIKHLSIYFKNDEQPDFCAVNDLNLNVEQGEILGIVGESGSGKSVTALSILGLLPASKAILSKEGIIKEFTDKKVAAKKNSK